MNIRSRRLTFGQTQQKAGDNATFYGMTSEFDINSTITSAYDKMSAYKGKGLRQGERQRRIQKMNMNLKKMELSRIATSKMVSRINSRQPTPEKKMAKLMPATEKKLGLMSTPTKPREGKW